VERRKAQSITPVTSPHSAVPFAASRETPLPPVPHSPDAPNAKRQISGWKARATKENHPRTPVRGSPEHRTLMPPSYSYSVRPRGRYSYSYSKTHCRHRTFAPSFAPSRLRVRLPLPTVPHSPDAPNAKRQISGWKARATKEAPHPRTPVRGSPEHSPLSPRQTVKPTPASPISSHLPLQLRTQRHVLPTNLTYRRQLPQIPSQPEYTQPRLNV